MKKTFLIRIFKEFKSTSNFFYSLKSASGFSLATNYTNLHEFYLIKISEKGYAYPSHLIALMKILVDLWLNKKMNFYFWSCEMNGDFFNEMSLFFILFQ